MNDALTQVFQQDTGAQVPVRVAVHGPESPEPQVFQLMQAYGIVGRSPNCDIRLKHAEVSFRHAYLQMLGGRLFCADLGSREGMTWRGAERRAGWLTADDEVGIGPYRIRLHTESSSPDSAEASTPPNFDPLAVYTGQMGALPDVRLEFLNAVDNIDLRVRRMLTFAGSSRGCKLRFEGDRISRVHCSLLLTPHGLWVIDLLGKGGTKVNGSLIRSDRLNDGDVLKVGQFQMRVRYDGSGEAPFSHKPLEAETSVAIRASTNEQLPKRPPAAEVETPTDTEIIAGEPQARRHCGSLIDKLIVNKLLTREVIDEVVAGFGDRVPTFDDLSERLVGLKLISQWQADQLAIENSGPLILENRYQLIDRLGYGSMGNVFLAFDEALQSRVAVKIPHHSLLSTERLFKRFRRETLISANLIHPNIVRALNIGRGNRFVVLELVDGDDLRDLISRQGPTGPLMAVDVLIQIASALDFARSEGVVHRDVKPANILISQTGVAKLFDFGLAHLSEEALKKGVAGADAETIPTRPGFAVGTVHYMAPEQGQESDEVDTRSDIYSLGCTFYEMLKGTPPFEGDSQHEILKQHAEAPPPRIDDLDDGLAEILDTMLKKNPDERYQTPGELIAALTKWRTRVTAADGGDEDAAHAEQRRQFEQQREQWLQEIAQQREDIEQQRAEIQAELKREQDRLQEQQVSLERRQTELNERESQWQTQNAELEDRLGRAAADEARLQQQQEAIADERTKLNAEQTHLDAARGELEAATATLAATRSQLEDDRESLSRQQRELAERQAALTGLLDDHDTATQEMARDRDELVRQQQELDRTAAALASQREELERSQGELETRRQKLESDAGLLDGRRHELAQETTELDAAREQLRQGEADLAARRHELTAQRESLEAERTALSEARGQLETRRREFEADVEDHQSAVARLRSEREGVQQDRDELKRAQEEFEQSMAQLNDERQQLTGDREQLSAERAALQARAQKLRDALAEWLDE